MYIDYRFLFSSVIPDIIIIIVDIIIIIVDLMHVRILNEHLGS